MSAIDWPSGLPKPLAGTLQEGRVENFVNDARVVGAARRRARFTRTLKTFSFSQTLSNSHAADLRTFIDTTSAGGVSDFNWTHPVTAVTYEVRFAELPQIRQRTLGAWDVDVSLEEI